MPATPKPSPQSPGLGALINDLLSFAQSRGTPLTIKELSRFTGIAEDSLYGYKSRKGTQPKTTTTKCYQLAVADAQWTGRDLLERAKAWLQCSTGDARGLSEGEIRTAVHNAARERAKASGNLSETFIHEDWLMLQTGLTAQEKGILSVADERHLATAYATSLQLIELEERWLTEQLGADRCYVLCESLHVLRELTDWLEPLVRSAVHHPNQRPDVANKLSLFLAPNEMISDWEANAIEGLLLGASQKLPSSLKPHLRIFFRRVVPPAPVSIAGFACLRDRPLGVLLFGDDSLTNKLCQIYMNRNGTSALDMNAATAKARPLTTVAQIVNVAFLTHLFEANYIMWERGKGPNCWSFPPEDKREWLEISTNA